MPPKFNYFDNMNKQMITENGEYFMKEMVMSVNQRNCYVSHMLGKSLRPLSESSALIIQCLVFPMLNN